MTREVIESLGDFPITAILGPRQCGKSTLARKILKQFPHSIFLDLERPSDLRKLDDPEYFLQHNQDKLVCIDEIHLRPDLFPVLRVLVDENRQPGRFLILGSASPELLRQSSETLAGRIHFLELSPFTRDELLNETRLESMDFSQVWVRGGFPDSCLAKNEKHSRQWRDDFIRTFLERDIQQFGISLPSKVLRNLWTMLAHQQGQMLNLSGLGAALGVSHHTVRNYLGILEQTFMIRTLPSLQVNLKKRLVKRPKIYLRDSGILHSLLEIEDLNALMGHPVLGFSWEGWALEQILSNCSGWTPSFYRTSNGEEIDLILERGTRRFAFEFKASVSPKVSRGFKVTISSLQPEHTWIVAPVNEAYAYRPGVTVTGIDDVTKSMGKFLSG